MRNREQDDGGAAGSQHSLLDRVNDEERRLNLVWAMGLLCLVGSEDRGLASGDHEDSRGTSSGSSHL